MLAWNHVGAGSVDRCQPDRRDAEVDQVGEPGAHTGEIASVIGMGVTAVDHLVTRGQLVIGGVAVGEAVDHDQVEDVVGPERLGAACRLGDELPGAANGFSARGDLKFAVARLGFAGDRYLDKQGMSLAPWLDPRHLDRPVHDTDLGPVQAGPFDQQQQLLLVSLNPPGWRFDGVDDLSRGGQSVSEHGEEQHGPRAECRRLMSAQSPRISCPPFCLGRRLRPRGGGTR